jgi:hypothetical protein
MTNIYVLVAYIIAWLAVCVYLVILALRMHGARLELLAVEELVHEQQEQVERTYGD